MLIFQSLKRLFDAADGNYCYRFPRNGRLLRCLRLLFSKATYALAPYLELKSDGGSIYFFLPLFHSGSHFLREWEQYAPREERLRIRWKLPTGKRAWLPIAIAGYDDLLKPERSTAIAKAYLHRPQIDFLFDLSTESVNFDPVTTRILRSFQYAATAQGIPAARMLIISANASPDFELGWRALESDGSTFAHAGYHYYLYDITRRIILSEWFRKHSGALKHCAKRALDGHLRPKHFMTLNLKPRPHRLALMLFLLQRNYMSQGIVTYIGNPDVAPQVNVPPSVRALLELVDNNEEILQQFTRLEALRPITFERDAEEATGIWSKPQEVSRIIPEIHYYKELRIDTYVELVTETYFDDNSNLYITEKTLRPILRFQPFIHLGTPYVLRELQQMGFKTFSPLIDESYDTMLDPAERMAAILKEVDRLCAMPIGVLHENYCSMWNVFEHNFNHLIANMPALFRQDMQREVLPKLYVAG